MLHSFSLRMECCVLLAFGVKRRVLLLSRASGGLEGRRWAHHAPDGGMSAVLTAHRWGSPTRPARTHAHHAQTNVASSTKNIGAEEREPPLRATAGSFCKPEPPRRGGYPGLRLRPSASVGLQQPPRQALRCTTSGRRSQDRRKSRLPPDRDLRAKSGHVFNGQRQCLPLGGRYEP